MENMNQNQRELLLMKNAVSIISKIELWCGVNIRADKGEENLSDFEDVAIETIQSEACKGKKPKNLISDLRDNIMQTQTNEHTCK